MGQLQERALEAATNNVPDSADNLSGNRLNNSDGLKEVRDLNSKPASAISSEFPSADALLSGDSNQTTTAQPGDKPSSNLDPLMPAITDAVGKSSQEFVPKINSRVACAAAVSGVLNKSNPEIKVTTNNKALERNLSEQGYVAVPIDQAQPGDVIVGHRPDGMPGHAAIYIGNGMIFNNNSDSGKMQFDSVDKFKQGMHDKDGRWNKNGYSDVVVYRKPQPALKVEEPAKQPDATTGEQGEDNSLSTDWATLTAEQTETAMNGMSEEFAKDIKELEDHETDDPENISQRFRKLGQSLKGANAELAARHLNDSLKRLGLEQRWSFSGDSDRTLTFKSVDATQPFSEKVDLTNNGKGELPKESSASAGVLV